MHSQGGTVIAAIGFDDETDAVVETASHLAHRFGLGVRLVHAIPSVCTEEWMTSVEAFRAGETGWQPEDEKAQAAARHRLMHILEKRLGRDVRSAHSIVLGRPTPGLIAEAVAHTANLIIAAISADSAATAMFAGMSTALSLMHSAPLPVLIVKANAIPNFRKEYFRIFIADDLRNSSETMTQYAYRLATVMGNCKIDHVNVIPDYRRTLATKWRTLSSPAPEVDESVRCPPEVWTEERRLRMERLQQRGAPFRAQALNAGCVINTELLAGKVKDQIHAAVTKAAPDLVVGRHHRLHSRPLLVGKIPFQTMLRGSAAVLIVPPADELYAPLAFPCPMDRRRLPE